MELIDDEIKIGGARAVAASVELCPLQSETRQDEIEAEGVGAGRGTNAEDDDDLAIGLEVIARDRN